MSCIKKKALSLGDVPGFYGCVFKENDTYIHFNILEKGTHDKELRDEQRVDLEAGLDQDSTSRKENSEEETQNQSQTQRGPDAEEESEPTNYDGMLQKLHEKTNLKLAAFIVHFHIILFYYILKVEGLKRFSKVLMLFVRKAVSTNQGLKLS